MAQNGYLTNSEVAALLHVSPKTVTRWAKEGKLSFQRTLGGHRRFSQAVIEALVEGLQVEAAQERAEAGPQ